MFTSIYKSVPANQQRCVSPDVQSQVMCLNPPLMSHEAVFQPPFCPRVIGPGSFRHTFMGNALLESGRAFFGAVWFWGIYHLRGVDVCRWCRSGAKHHRVSEH